MGKTEVEAFNRLDSLGVLQIGEKRYVLHAVEKGETIYSLAKRYSSNILAIRIANDLDNILSAGKVIRIPVGKWISDFATIREGDPVFHLIDSGQTLYGISRMYKDLSVDDLMSWNGLEDQVISIGDSLIVQYKNGHPPSPQAYKLQMLDSLIQPSVDLGSPKTKALREVTASAICELDIGVKLNPYKKYALHKSIPIGTIVRVRNQENRRVVYVKVIGRLREDIENVDMILSKSAAQQILFEGSRLKTELAYGLFE